MAAAAIAPLGALAGDAVAARGVLADLWPWRGGRVGSGRLAGAVAGLTASAAVSVRLHHPTVT